MFNDATVKEELHLYNQQNGVSASYAEGLLTFGGELVRDKNGLHFVYTATDYELVLELCALLKSVYGYAAEIGMKQPDDKRRKKTFSVEVFGKAALNVLEGLGKIVLKGGEVVQVNAGVRKRFASRKETADYMRAVYLTCGNLSRADTGYRVSLTFEGETDCDAVQALLAACGLELKKQAKDNKYYLSTRKGQAVSDFYAFIGASKSVLYVQDVLVQSEAKGRIARAANLDAANTDKSYSAAAKSLYDITYLKENGGFYGMPKELKATAEARLDYPDLTIERLAEKVEGGISKSGLYHRLKKLSDMAEELRSKKGNA